MNAQKEDFINKEKFLLVNIAKRTIKAMETLGYPTDDNSKIMIEMDLIAIALGENCLDLESLYAANDIDFCHDIFGIMNNINRKTSRLENNFKLKFIFN